MKAEIEYLENSDIYTAIVEEGLLRAKESVFLMCVQPRTSRTCAFGTAGGFFP